MTSPTLWVARNARGAYLGIDTVAFSGPVSAVRDLSLTKLDASHFADWDTGEITRDRTMFRLRSGARLTITDGAGVRHQSATVEASLPKLVTGSNFDPLSVMQATFAMRSLYDEVAEGVRWEASFLSLRLTRVDATGHISGVTERDRLLRTMALLPVPRLPPTSLRNDDRRGGALTLARGPGRRWKMVAYDKHAEVEARSSRSRGATKAAALRDLNRARGVLRCELVLRRPVLRALALDTIAQLDDDRLGREHRRRFHEVGLGLSIKDMGRIVREVVAVQNLKPQSQMMMLAVLLCDFYGEETGLKSDVVRKYRKHARALGFVPEAFAEQGPAVRLDYDLARQVREAA